MLALTWADPLRQGQGKQQAGECPGSAALHGSGVGAFGGICLDPMTLPETPQGRGINAWGRGQAWVHFSLWCALSP